MLAIYSMVKAPPLRGSWLAEGQTEGGIPGGHCTNKKPDSHKPSGFENFYTEKGIRLGFMTTRQSRSPRARPWMSSSAVAMLVA